MAKRRAPDVEQFPGHIACDGDSKSEIVVPIMKAGKTEQPFRFLDLPRKLRDRIYNLALVHDPPIELAGLVPGQRHEDFWEEVDDNGQPWYAQRYQEQIALSAQLLRTGKQICQEATPIFYGQRFRFTDQAG
ncbi:hypothetical protein B0A55_06765 [Friedmanniomyces simplex]|uniref:Uncharacterized protein n=1 Tax=Friedmanniomyces simplex TaxID=329884 RepID=A0A4U0XCR0_9PEZI|nr:hypothetical protein B0A55_06765 [Friedmanniomyces simplex]